MDLRTLDKRLQKRLVRARRISQDEIDKAAAKLKDLSGNVYEPTEEEIERLKQQVVTEQRVRGERIGRLLERRQKRGELPDGEPAPELEE